MIPFHFVCEPVTKVYLSDHFPRDVAHAAVRQVAPVAEGYRLRFTRDRDKADIIVRWSKNTFRAHGWAEWEYVDDRQLANGVIRINYGKTRDESFSQVVTLVMHEFGHVFGLKHREGNVVMNAGFVPTATWRGSDLRQWRKHTGLCPTPPN